MPSESPSPGTVPVRLTIRPDETTHVPEDEVPILRQQGLLVEDDTEATAPVTDPASTGTTSGATVKAPAKSSAKGGDA